MQKEKKMKMHDMLDARKEKKCNFMCVYFLFFIEGLMIEIL